MNIKKLLFYVIAFIGIVLSGCSEEEYIETDYNQVNVGFRIVSADGTDLIAEGGELYGADFSVIYDGEIYKANWNYDKSRMNAPIFDGLIYSDYVNKKNGFPMLLFGLLDGYHCNAYIFFRMPNGESHEIHIVRSHDPKLRQTVTLDGIKIPEMSDGRYRIYFTFVYKAN